MLIKNIYVEIALCDSSFRFYELILTCQVHTVKLKLTFSKLCSISKTEQKIRKTKEKWLKEMRKETELMR